MPDENLQEKLAARKAARQQKKTTKPKTKAPVKKAVETPPPVEAPTEPVETILDEGATVVLPEEENAVVELPEANTAIVEAEVTPETVLPPPDTDLAVNKAVTVPAYSASLGGYGTIEGTFFDKMMREVVYILSLGGKFDRAFAPHWGKLPLVSKMKVPADKYLDYINRVGYPDYSETKEAYSVSLSAPDYRVMMGALEANVAKGWEIDPKQACMNKGRYVVPFRTRFPVENKPGLSCKMRERLTYTVADLENLTWEQLLAVKALFGVESNNYNAIMAQLKKIIEETN